MDRIYFDNAASSFPKPKSVIDAMTEYLTTCGNPGRGAHQFALDAARTIFDARETVAEFLGISASERLIFTGGCTTSLNMVLKGLAEQGVFKEGDSILVSSREHNSVMRPIVQLQDSLGIMYFVAPVGDNFEADLKELVAKHSPKLVALTWASNVTGELLPVPTIAKWLKQEGIMLLVDGAQTAGKFDVHLEDSGISFYCASGHKGLLGPPGVGLLYLAPGVSLYPVIAGGTGSRSESLAIPSVYPDRLEAGTLPGPAIAGLAAGVEWVKQHGSREILNAELKLVEQFINWAGQVDYINLFGPTKTFDGDGSGARMPIVSLTMRGLSPSDLALVLDTEYGIAARPGLHCSALTHESLSTMQTGLLRLSFGLSNTQEEVERLCNALEEIASKIRVS
ncbi:MAG: aminotransferase class V-fold PLP-dependent enzyme [Candidatus Obscuribacterales bacterium]|nr:aminotransferase class V-fold PLP-dependent enzyme [Candidatus Obscuribacterales bacterium]